MVGHAPQWPAVKSVCQKRTRNGTRARVDWAGLHVEVFQPSQPNAPQGLPPLAARAPSPALPCPPHLAVLVRKADLAVVHSHVPAVDTVMVTVGMKGQ